MERINCIASGCRKKVDPTSIFCCFHWTLLSTGRRAEIRKCYLRNPNCYTKEPISQKLREENLTRPEVLEAIEYLRKVSRRKNQ